MFENIQSYILEDYLRYYDYATNFELCVYDLVRKEPTFIKPVIRFDAAWHYRQTMRFADLEQLPATYFLTITLDQEKFSQWLRQFKVDDFQAFKLQKMFFQSHWKKFRAIWNRYGDGTIQYLRTLEFQENNMLHVHMAFYSEHDKDLLASYMRRFLHEKLGFIKVFKTRSLNKDYYVSEELRIDDVRNGAILPYFYTKEKVVQGSPSKYVLKYITKRSGYSFVKQDNKWHYVLTDSKKHFMDRARHWKMKTRAVHYSKGLPVAKFHNLQRFTSISSKLKDLSGIPIDEQSMNIDEVAYLPRRRHVKGFQYAYIDEDTHRCVCAKNYLCFEHR